MEAAAAGEPRQRALPNDYIGRQGMDQRIAVVRVLLGADDETVDALRQEPATRTKEWKTADNRVKRILRDRKERDLPSVEVLEHRAQHWTEQREKALAEVETDRLCSQDRDAPPHRATLGRLRPTRLGRVPRCTNAVGGGSGLISVASARAPPRPYRGPHPEFCPSR